MTDLIPTTDTTPTFPGLELSATGAALVGPLDRPAVLAAVTALLGRESATRWQVGDLMVALIADDDGDPARTFRQMAGAGYEQAWLTNSIAVAVAVTPDRRRPTLSWGHHELVAHLDPDDQGRLLGLAVAANWTKTQLARQLDDEARAGQEQLDTGDTGHREPPRWPAIRTAVSEAWKHDPTKVLVLYPDGRVRPLDVAEAGR